MGKGVKVETQAVDAIIDWSKDTVEQTGRLGQTLTGAGITKHTLTTLQTQLPSNPPYRASLSEILDICGAALGGKLVRERLLNGPGALAAMNRMQDRAWRLSWGRVLGCYLTARLAVLEDPAVRLPAPGAV